MLGFDPADIAKQTQPIKTPEAFEETARSAGQLPPDSFEAQGDDETLDLVRLRFHDVFVRRRFTTIHETHREGIHMLAPGHSNQRVSTLAISQLRIKDHKIHKHYLVMDELAILSQLLA